MVGPGQYDDVCGEVKKLCRADGILLAIIGGVKGSGCSVKLNEDALAIMPKLLREIADDLEAASNMRAINDDKN